MSDDFKYRAVIFSQPGCPACNAMKPVWAKVAGEIAQEYPELHVGFGEMDVTNDDWEFLESLTPESGQGTPEIAVFDEECELIGFEGSGVLAASQLKDFLLTSILGGH